MRLVCPQCAAQYEVDINAIPEDGRDVQCANCGNTWFQERETDTPVPADEAQLQDNPEHQDDADNQPDRPQPTPVDQSVLDILRAEAKADTEARQSANVPQVSQAPMVENVAETEAEHEEIEAEEKTPSSDNLAERARAARSQLTSNRERPRRPQIENTEARQIAVQDPPRLPRPAAEPQEVAPAPQRTPPEQHPDGELPDVDTLNSTLRSADDKSRKKNKRGKPKKGSGKSGRFGFYSAILVFLVLVALYALKPQVISAYPEAAPMLDQYTELVDLGRHALANGVNTLIQAAQNLLAQYM